MSIFLRSAPELYPAFLIEQHMEIRRGYVNMARPHDLAGFGMRCRQMSSVTEDRRQLRTMPGGKMDDDENGGGEIFRELGNDKLQGLYSAGGCADHDDVPRRRYPLSPF